MGVTPSVAAPGVTNLSDATVRFIHIHLIKSLTYRKPYSNNKARKI